MFSCQLDNNFKQQIKLLQVADDVNDVRDVNDEDDLNVLLPIKYIIIKVYYYILYKNIHKIIENLLFFCYNYKTFKCFIVSKVK